MSKNGEWSYNDSKMDNWGNEKSKTKEDAIKQGLITAKEDGWDKLFVGQLATIQVDTTFDGDDILLAKSEQIDEEYGSDFNFGESWLDSISEEDVKLLERMLCEIFEKWLYETKNHPKDMYIIEKIEQIIIE